MKTLLILIVLLWAAPVTAAEQGLSLAKSTGASWLQLIDQGHYDKSWQQADAFFKAQLSSDTWQHALGGTRAPLGKVLTRHQKSSQALTSLPGAPDGEYLVLTFSTEFEHKAKAVETLTLSKQSGQWRAIGYFIK
ncbi:DUF4019 domain-containing protein [Thalassotalea euphylliae]|uniref:DUF4019 domain-containing protein n=2 Tax=Thalassotalea euphylliae TaxID=1655234 RepID=A0A3E0TP14_9GAMM|nr:DUF4019 domain-containing protein [Thalassotalea euphylliae]